MRYWLFLVLLFFHCNADERFSDRPYLLVSVSPHRFFLEKIAGSTVEVGLLVPAGASAHTFEPTPKQMMSAGKAQIWFRIGEPFEERAIDALKSHHPNMKIVDLREGLDLIDGQCHCHSKGYSHHHSLDLHFWLSARLAKIQAETMAKALMATFPENQELYKQNLAAFQQQLDQLDSEISLILQPMKNRNIFVSHPAYAYFCRDYGLQQHSIEVEGKDPTPQQLTRTLQMARNLNIQTLFIQMQYNNKGAKLIAEEIGAR